MEGFEISGVERKRYLAASTGFDFFDESQADFDMDVGATDIDIEEDYLGKLKTQRERMEKLEKGYIEKETELDREIERVIELNTEIERLNCFVIYKEKYDNLKLDFSDLLTKYNTQKNEFQIVKEELNETIISNNFAISRLKSELKKWKEVSTLNVNHLEESLKDKEDEVRKIRNDFKDKEDQLSEENNHLRTLIDKIKSQIEIEVNLQDEKKEKSILESQTRENFILNLEKTLDQTRKANFQIKSESDKIQEEMMSRESELSWLCNKLKNQITIQKKSIEEKEEKISGFESELKKSGVLVKDLRNEIMEIKADYQKTCDLYELQNQKIQNETDSQICRLQTFINELKYEIEELMQVKNHLLVENKKLNSTLKRKEQSDRQRKQLLHTEFKEIDRISKVIDRLE